MKHRTEEKILSLVDYFGGTFLGKWGKPFMRKRLFSNFYQRSVRKQAMALSIKSFVCHCGNSFFDISFDSTERSILLKLLRRGNDFCEPQLNSVHPNSKEKLNGLVTFIWRRSIHIILSHSKYFVFWTKMISYCEQIPNPALSVLLQGYMHKYAYNL